MLSAGKVFEETIVNEVWGTGGVFFFSALQGIFDFGWGNGTQIEKSFHLRGGGPLYVASSLDAKLSFSLDGPATTLNMKRRPKHKLTQKKKEEEETRLQSQV